MKILDPLCITSRLLPGVRIGEAEISIEYAHRLSDYRQRYRWFIDLPNDGGEFQGDDLQSGVGEGSLQEGLTALLVFLGAFAESLLYCEGKEGDNCHLFPAGLKDWAMANSDEIGMLAYELEESPEKFIVE